MLSSEIFVIIFSSLPPAAPELTVRALSFNRFFNLSQSYRLSEEYKPDIILLISSKKYRRV